MPGQCSEHSPAQTHVKPRAEMWAQAAREEVWLAAVPRSGEQGFAQRRGGAMQSLLQPRHFSLTAQDAPKPLLSPRVSSSRAHRARPALLWEERSSRLHHPLFSLFSSPCSCSPCQKLPELPGAPRAGGAGLPARHNTNQMMYSKRCQYAHPQERRAGRGEGGKGAGWSFGELSAELMSRCHQARGEAEQPQPELIPSRPRLTETFHRRLWG